MLNLMKFFVSNVRRGHATNSSSSHSLVYYKEKMAGEYVGSPDSYDLDYGWGNFVLDTLGEKLMYGLTSLVGEGWWGRYDDGSFDQKVDEQYEKYGHLFPEFTREHFAEAVKGYVDHQSRNQDPSFIDELRDPHTVVHGGNDNDGYFGDYNYSDEQKFGPGVEKVEDLGRF